MTTCFRRSTRKNRIFQARAHVSTANRPPILLGDPRIAAEMGERATSRVAAYPLRKAVEAQVLERFCAGPCRRQRRRRGRLLFRQDRQVSGTRRGSAKSPAPHNGQEGIAPGLACRLARSSFHAFPPSSGNSVIIEDDDERSRSLALTIEPLADRGIGEPL